MWTTSTTELRHPSLQRDLQLGSMRQLDKTRGKTGKHICRYWVSTNASFRHNPILSIAVESNSRPTLTPALSATAGESNQTVHPRQGPSPIYRAQSGEGAEDKRAEPYNQAAASAGNCKVRRTVNDTTYPLSRHSEGNVDWEEGTGTGRGVSFRIHGP